MSESLEPGQPPQSRRRKAPWPGLVWSIPLAAFIVVGYLGIHAFTQRGEIVTVTFRRAADARPNDTKVLYQGVEAGHLVKIVPNEDGRRLDFLLRLRPEAKPGLNSNARFWLIGASPNLADLSSLKAVVSGVAIGYAPGEGGTPTTTFEGLDKAPTVLPGDRGTRYLLTARSLGSIREGSGLLYHGQPIGKVAEVKFNGAAGFRLEVFVFQPYDSLVKPGARFWRISPLHLSLAGGSLNATLAPASTLLSGGIDVEVATADPSSAKSPAEAEFPLYANHDAARWGLSGPTARYDFAFAGPAGELEEDAPVTLLGFQIGEIESARLAYDDSSGKPYTIVTAVLYPQQLDIAAPSAGAAGWQSATDAKLRKLIHVGYRARLQQRPAIVGNQSIALIEVKRAPRADLAYGGANPRIPSAPSTANMDDIGAQANQILAKVNDIPIAEIGKNLQQLTSRLSSLASSPKTGEGLSHLNNTLAELDQMLGQLQPQLEPLMTKLNEVAGQLSAAALAAHQLLDSQGGTQGDSLPEAIQQLTEAARSVRSLADYLDRHPEALIRGKRPER
jgi:paraquat-inducible protein B